MNRKTAEIKLKQTFGFDQFHDKQWETINQILQGKRVLLIEKTGFGKSLCFQFPATQFDGITIVFSPLIALMRDQVRALNQKGISAKVINSEQNKEENEQILNEAKAGRLKILYIAPERQENQDWLMAVREFKISMIVIDEAHTISVWGHDFRPAFRRIINLVRLLPEGLPVLATTATATPRVQADIGKQITGDVKMIRGSLLRENFELYVINVNSEDEKYIWLGQNLNQLPGTGIIYTGTRVNTLNYARWFDFLKIPASEYNAGLDAESRKDIENGLMENRWKAVVSTNALGMGIDKPDIRFIIHTQIPASPIHYYQEIGRAGRDGKPAKIILFYNSSKDRNGLEEDYKLPKSFIDGSKPSKASYNRVIDTLKAEPMGEQQIMKATNLKQTPVRVIKADLIEQGIIKEVKYGRIKRYEYQYNAPKIDFKAFEELRKQKLEELNSMIEYVNLKSSRMQFLCDYLGDDNSIGLENCDNTNLKPFKAEPNKELENQLVEFRESYFPEITLESKKSNMVNGVAASYYGVSAVGSAIHRSKYENGGDFPDHLLKLTLKAFRKRYGKSSFDLFLYVPPTESGDLVKNFAEKIARILKIPISHSLIKVAPTKPQKEFDNWLLKRENVDGKFLYQNPAEINGKSIILFDDICDSGATLKEIGKMLSSYGAERIAPLVIAKTVGGDI